MGMQSVDTSSKEPWPLSLNVDELRVKSKASCENARRLRPAVFRVPPYIRKLRPNCYDVDVLPLGLYNRNFTNQSPIDHRKLAVLGVFLEHLQVDQQAWKTFSTEVATPPPGQDVPDLEHFYGDDVGHSLVTKELAQSVLVIDAFFVIAFFIWRMNRAGRWSKPSDPPPLLVYQTLEILSRASMGGIYTSVVDDIFWRCENQIPLFLLKNVWDKVASHGGDKLDFDTLLKKTVKITLAGSGLPVRYPAAEVHLESCDHLLHCLHRALCPDGASPLLVDEDSICRCIWRHSVMKYLLKFATQITSTVSRLLLCKHTRHRQSRLTTIPSASELRKSGVHFRGIETDVGGVRFVKSIHHLAATLYLPKMKKIDDCSENRILNMCLYESMMEQHTSRGLIPYICLIDELINGEEDVRLLMQGSQPVIEANFMGDDMMLVRLFTNVLQKFCVKTHHRDEVQIVRAEIWSWYRKRWRRQTIGFIDRFVRAPWLLVSLTAAFILLVLSLVQTIYTVMGFYSQ